MHEHDLPAAALGGPGDDAAPRKDHALSDPGPPAPGPAPAAVVGVAAGHGRHLGPAVGAELPGQDVVLELDSAGSPRAVDERGVEYRGDGTRPAGRGCAASGRPSRCSTRRPRVARRSGRCASARGSGRRSIAPGCARDSPGDPGPQAADAANDEVDLARRPATRAYSASIISGRRGCSSSSRSAPSFGGSPPRGSGRAGARAA